MRLGIATKVFIAFAGVTLIFSAVLMFGIYRTQLLHGQLRALNHRIVPLSLQLSDIQNDLKSFHIVLNERDPAVLRRTLQLTRLLNALPDSLDEAFLDAANTADLSELTDVPATAADAFAAIHDQLLELHLRGVDFAARTIEFSSLVLNDTATDEMDMAQIQKLQDELREEARHLDTRLSAVRAELHAAIDHALVRADDTERSSVYGLGLLSFLALVIALALMFLVIVTLRPLTTLTEASKRIGEGDYRPIPIPRRKLAGKDELTLLTQEFNAMVQRLTERDERLRSQHATLLKSERLATIGRMTSLITHELRNPLSSINLNAEMLMDSLHDRGIDPQDPEVMPLLQTIIEEVDHLSEITEEYLVYARLPTPKLHSEQLDDILQGLIDFHVWEWNQKKVEIELHNDDVPDISADANQLRQAFLNILKNAIEASSAGDIVEVHITRAGEQAVVSIRDHGQGMDRATRNRLFEPFFTTKSSGTGLGLPMTQQIIEEHHGEIIIESTPGEGTTFRIKLPLSKEAPEGAEDSQETGAAKAS